MGLGRASWVVAPLVASLGLVALGCDTDTAKAGTAVSSSASARAPAGATASAAPPPSSTGSAATSPSASASAPAESAAGFEREDLPEPDVNPSTLDEQRDVMLRRMKDMGVIDDKGVDGILAILKTSKWAGQGNPEVVEHPLTRAECIARRKEAGVHDEKKPLCKAPFMVPLYDSPREKEADAKVCIDRYEFPGLPCEYPMTWISTEKAEAICKVMGKRLCDAHEWEGGCAGSLRPAEDEYAFGRDRKTMRGLHNLHREIRWAYGTKKDHAKCGTMSNKSKTCTSSGWKRCGSNTYPAGSFPECKSPFGVYDQHGNVAEHMALPMRIEELGSRGGFGEPEMKGSWFIFGRYEAHIDDCRWRSPDWHANEGKNHSNYHLGFRCCKDL